jgi:uncharacterized RDD family membrane protein YckC
MLYEAMLLFGVVFITSWLFDTLTQSRSALMLRHARQMALFVVLGVYFVYFWHRSGQTLAMKTWKVRLIYARTGQPAQNQVPWSRALLRYLLAWMWFMPAVALDYVLDLKGWASVALIVLGMALWGATILFNRDRQFLHDQLVGTRLITYDPPELPRKKKR